MSGGDRDLAATHALGALPSDEEATVEEEVARNAALAAEVQEYRGIIEALDSGIARDALPPGLFDVVLSRIEAERSAALPEPVGAPEPTVTKRRGIFGADWRRAIVPFAAGFAVAAAVVVIAVAVSSGADLGTPDARAAVRGTPEFSAVHGEAQLYSTSSQDGVLVLDLDDVPPPAANKHYEVWVLRASSGGAMEAVGAFTPDGSQVRLKLGLPGAGDYEAVDISVEPDGGSASHSGSSLAGGRFEPVS